jgi:hypothetical protein
VGEAHNNEADWKGILVEKFAGDLRDRDGGQSNSAYAVASGVNAG